MNGGRETTVVIGAKTIWNGPGRASLRLLIRKFTLDPLGGLVDRFNERPGAQIIHHHQKAEAAEGGGKDTRLLIVELDLIGPTKV